EAAEQQRKDVERAAERAQGAADRLAKLARSEEANEAGLQVALEQAAQQAREAARKMRAAAQASQDGGNRRAQEDAQAAAEQAAGAARRLGAAVQEREELPERQRKIEEDLRRLREDSQDRHAAELRKAQDEAAKAVTELRGGRFQEALPHQKAIEASLQKMGAQANAEVQRAGREVQAKMERLQNATLAAADKAGKTREALKQGKQSARERDARERLDDAERHTEEAEKALRRSLRRLTEARPKSAEEERRQAREELGRAQDRLNGVREAHKRLTDEEREQLRKLAQKQHNLEDQVRRLEERLRKQNERGAAERMQDAQSAMRDAQRGMRGGDPDEAEQGQDRAQKSLQQAQDELERQERRYRNLRQHELLFRLKEQLRAYRRSAQAFLEELQAIDAEARRAGRVKRNLYRSSVVPLKDKVSAMSRDVGEKVESIKEEGAVVYTYILTQCQSDLSEVAGLLAMKEVGILPQELTGDVVRRFDLTLKGLERDLRERRDDQQNQQQRGQKGQQGQQSPEERPRLVPQDAEIRMILVLQRTLNEETNNFFKARPRFADRRTTESEKARLERLAHQQGSLGELFESLKESLLPAGDGTGDLELPPKPGDGEKPGKEEQPGGDGARNVPRGVPLQGMPGQQTIEDLQKQMKEISRLMQESERELLELTTLDRIVKQQSELRRKLEELERAKEPETEAKREARRKKRGELERGQEQTRRRIADLLQGPEMRGHQLVSSLEKLLRSMPRGSKGGGRGGKQGKQPKPRQLDPNKEQMQTQPKDGKRTKNEPRERKPEDKPGSGADARRRVEAWLARLPPEEQELIRRGDLSGVPLRYRPIIERITVERAAREGKGSGE
ncbi:MAG: hypothetical protein ACE10D_10335, partial [Planctomycetota bacterium]